MIFDPPTGEPVSTAKPNQGWTVNLTELDELVKHNAEIVTRLADQKDWVAYATAEATRALAHSSALEACLHSLVGTIYETLGYKSAADGVQEYKLARTDLQERALHEALHAIEAKIAKQPTPSAHPSAYL